MNRLIIYLIRKKLGLKKHQGFYFKNQVDEKNRYYFNNGVIYKVINNAYGSISIIKESNIRLNFLLSDEAKELLVKV